MPGLCWQGAGRVITLMLPYPISANVYWRTTVVRGRVMTYVSPAAKLYKSDAGWLAKSLGVKVLEGDVSVSYVLYPKLTAADVASKVRVDLDNALKVLGDALNGVAWIDDKQIVDLHARIGAPVKDGAIAVTISQYIGVCDASNLSRDSRQMRPGSVF
jgi:crossover junction endodeoxyribonuclease RusA